MAEQNIKLIKNNKKRGRPAGAKNKEKQEIIYLIKRNNILLKLNNKIIKENINLKNELNFIKSSSLYKLVKKWFFN